MSEFPDPWHRIAPAEWSRVGRRIRSLLRAADTGRLELPVGTVAGLRRVLPPPLPIPKLTPPVTPYGQPVRRRTSPP
jgi:hypothetical protein